MKPLLILLAALATGGCTIEDAARRSVLTEAKVRRLYELHEAGRTQQQIADALGVFRTTVGCVLRGKTWTHIPRHAP